MGTNYYYYKEPACSCCGRKGEAIHIGKSSCGWCFSLHVGYQYEDIPRTIADWKDAFKVSGSFIEDEYGTVVPVDEMIDNIENRSRDERPKWTQHEYSQNHAELGPRNLIRHVVDGRHCIGHGEGTFDYCVGEFS